MSEQHEAGAIQSDVELYDSDRLQLKALVGFLNQRNVGKSAAVLSPQKYATELVERFFKVGYHVEVRMYALEDTETGDIVEWQPSILIEARVEPEEEFDHDRMRYEVRSDILGQNKQGNIQQKSVGQAGYSRTGSGLIVPGGGPV